MSKETGRFRHRVSFVSQLPDDLGDLPTVRVSANCLKRRGLQDWLGGRDSNPDNVVQSGGLSGRASLALKAELRYGFT